MKTPRAFSLVEVTIAIGVLSFCLLAILGLLPTGMRVMEQAREESRAMQSLTALAASIRSASSADLANYTAAAPFTNLGWRIGGPRVDASFFLTEEAKAVVSAAEPGVRQKVFVSLVPPPDSLTPGTAYVGVAWPAAVEVSSWQTPASANMAAAPVLSREKGYVSTTIIFGGAP